MHIQEVILNLLLKQPFYGYIAASVTPVKSKEVSTTSMMITPTLKLLYNREWYEGLKEEQAAAEGEVPNGISGFINEIYKVQEVNWRSTSDFTSGHPMVGEPDALDIITINFSNMSYVNIGEYPKEILGNLKAKYMEKIKDKITSIEKIWVFMQPLK